MSDTEINVAMAELHGWTWILESGPADYMALRNPLGGLVDTNTNQTADFPSHLVPDYANDLNAMHEAVTSLTHEQLYRYANLLCDLTNPNCMEMAYVECPEAGMYPGLFRATAAQQAEVVLRTFGKWKEEA